MHFYTPDPIPIEGTVIADVEVKRTLLRGVRRKPTRRPINRSGADAAARRRRIRIGIPRVLNLYSSAPVWRTYFETLGIAEANVVFSDPTSEEMWAEGSRYGSIDPCYPSKVSQAHIHNLIFKKHAKHKLDFIFFPCITHATFVAGTGIPAADRRRRAQIMRGPSRKRSISPARDQYVDDAVTLQSRTLCPPDVRDLGRRLGDRGRKRPRLPGRHEGAASVRQRNGTSRPRAARTTKRTQGRVLLLGRPTTWIPVSTTACRTSTRRSGIRS